MPARFPILVLITSISFAQSDVAILRNASDRCEVCCQAAHQDNFPMIRVPERRMEDSNDDSDTSSEASHTSSSEGSHTSASEGSHTSASEGSHASASEGSHASASEGSHASASEGSHASASEGSHASSAGHSSSSASGSGASGSSQSSSAGGSLGSGSGSGSASGGGHGPWWNHEYEYAHFEAWVIVALVLITMLFDEIHHKTEEMAAHAGHDGLLKHFLEHHHAKKVHTTNMWEDLHNRASGELAVLGFLALLVWCCNQGGLFTKLADVDWHMDIKMPPSASQYLHTVENVHMHLFIAMAIYFLFTGVVIACATRFIHMAVDANYELKMDYKAGLLQDGMTKEERHAYYKKKKRFGRMFFQLREYYFHCLEMWRGEWEFLDEHLKGMKDHLLKNAQIDAEVTSKATSGADPFKEMTIGRMMRKWFPFDLYVVVNYRHTIDSLLEISLLTWFIILFVLLVTAVIQQNVQANFHMREAAFIIAQIVIVGMGCTVWALWKNAKKRVIHNAEARLVRSHWVHRIHPVRNVVRVLQICMFFSVYELAQQIADPLEWEDRPAVCAIYIVGLVLGCLGEGMLIGGLLPLYSVLISTGPYMQEGHVERMQAITKVYAVNTPLKLRQLAENIEEFDEVVAETEIEYREQAEKKEKLDQAQVLEKAEENVRDEVA